MDPLIAAKGDAVRPGVEALAEQLIGFLDATAGDPELEEENERGDGGADGEPTLGASDAMNQKRAWSFGQTARQGGEVATAAEYARAPKAAATRRAYRSEF